MSAGENIAEKVATATEGFANRCLSPTDLGALAGIITANHGDGSHLLPIVQVLTRHPAMSFPSLSELCASIGRKPPSRRTILNMRDLFLGVADARLQELYRDYLRQNPAPAGLDHYGKIAHLHVLEAEAQSIVDSYEWEWLVQWLNLPRIGITLDRCIQRLSNLAFKAVTVNFRFTYHCNIACRHCYNNSGPSRKSERIPLDRMLAVVAQMPEAGLDRLIITGGEPFLYPADLTALVAAARAAQVSRISINSNAFWATSDAKVQQILGQLAEAGFMQTPADNLKISSGIYHLEFVALERIFTVARNYYEMFGRPLFIDFELENGREALREEATERFRAAGLLDRVSLAFRTISAVGRGATIEGLDLEPYDAPCGVIDEIVFDPDGKVRPCCGLNNENDGVVIGALETHGLKVLVKRMQNDPVLQFLSRKPMPAIYEKLGRAGKPEGYAGVCELCQHAIGDLEDKEPLQAELFASQRFYPFWFKHPA
jgi:hypothetical protein